jgi:pyruvate dehydrogenase complex dehydrogenase (E1) component
MRRAGNAGRDHAGSREKLDNLTWIINCNLQRLDGPVRGNGKIIQELEGIFRGAGWNVIKVIWGEDWDPLLENDESGELVRRMGEIVDGQYQKYTVEDGEYARQHFFNSPYLQELAKDLSDEDLTKLRRGGHDPVKVYAAYKAATEHKGQPTVILAKTVKGYGLGPEAEGRNPTHQQKKLQEESLKRSASASIFRLRKKKSSTRRSIVRRRQPGNAVSARASQGAGRLRAFSHATNTPVRRQMKSLRASSTPVRATRTTCLRRQGFRLDSQHADARQGNRQADRADYSRRSAHLRHGRHVPLVRHLRQHGPVV